MTPETTPDVFGPDKLAEINELDALLDRLAGGGTAPGGDLVLSALASWAADIDPVRGQAAAGVGSAAATAPTQAVPAVEGATVVPLSPRPTRLRRAAAAGALLAATFTGSSVAAAVTGSDVPVLTDVGRALVGVLPGGDQLLAGVDAEDAEPAPPEVATSSAPVAPPVAVPTAAYDALHDIALALGAVAHGPGAAISTSATAAPQSVAPVPATASGTFSANTPAGATPDPAVVPPLAPAPRVTLPDRTLPGVPLGECRGQGRGLGCEGHPTKGPKNPGAGMPAPTTAPAVPTEDITVPTGDEVPTATDDCRGETRGLGCEDHPTGQPENPGEDIPSATGQPGAGSTTGPGTTAPDPTGSSTPEPIGTEPTEGSEPTGTEGSEGTGTEGSKSTVTAPVPTPKLAADGPSVTAPYPTTAG